MDFDLRPVKADEMERWATARSRGFGQQLDRADFEVRRSIYDLSRTVGVFDGEEVVGTSYSSAWRINVPGGSLPVAGIVAVTVQPTHRRRGILTNMMSHQLADVHRRGEPIAALYASESIIYGRFGFGMSVMHESWSIERVHSALAMPARQSGRVRFVTVEEMRKTFPDIQARALKDRPGAILRPEWDWDRRVRWAAEPPPGFVSPFYAIYEASGAAQGYVSYMIDKGDLTVVELMSVTDEAHAALWSFVFGVDLVNVIRVQKRPVDDPLQWMLADPRSLRRTPHDGAMGAMWTRIVDVPAALSGRIYLREGRLVLEVHDPFCPWNNARFALEAGPDGAACSQTAEAADLTLSAADLGAAYLGGVTFSTLSHAGRIEGRTPGALRRADAMFAWDLQPWCPFSY
ncbi:MAG: GNAT family N-acetyltransferase [SAR202 cluster bacterium]|nr:GNAT family N-acetyltransferase [SAR202 cluster bacterium]